MQLAVIELGLHGLAASEAVDGLKQLLDHESQWVRVHAARALWRITQKHEQVLPTLLHEFQCSPAGFLVVDCLGQLGPHAAPALRKLKAAIESERRLPVTGTTRDWCAEDEAFRDACAVALERIGRPDRR